MSPDKLSAGYLVRYMMGVDEIPFYEARRLNQDLTPKAYAMDHNIEGNTEVVRVYNVSGDGGSIVVLPMEDFGSGIPVEHEDFAIKKIEPEILRGVFDNNVDSFRLRGVTEFDTAAVSEWVYGLPLEVYLAGHWGLIHTEEVAEIGPRQVWGKAETSLGEMKVNSY